MKRHHKILALLAGLAMMGIAEVSYSTSTNVHDLRLNASTGELSVGVRGGDSQTFVQTSQSLDISNSGSFSAGNQLLYISKSGHNVILSFPSLAHTSSSNPISAVGFIPSKYAPPFGIVNDFEYSGGSASLLQVAVLSDGTLKFFYYNTSSGSLAARTSTGAGSISWVIP